MKILKRIQKWFCYRRECAWCKPSRYMGGNPWAKKVTHGLCPRCKAVMRVELMKLPH